MTVLTQAAARSPRKIAADLTRESVPQDGGKSDTCVAFERDETVDDETVEAVMPAALAAAQGERSCFKGEVCKSRPCFCVMRIVRATLAALSARRIKP